jgi:hypothetical protein
MSLLSRNGGAPRRGALVAVAGVAAIAGTTALAPAVLAAEIYYQPIVSLSSAYNTNLDLDQFKQSAVGYFADAATIVGIATPTSQTTLMPRLFYNYYPTQSYRNRLEEFLNLNSNYSWQRDRFSINGLFNHRDDSSNQFVNATFNPVTPGLGNTTTTGRVQVGSTSNWLILDPTYSHTLTPLSRIGVSGEYQRMDFSATDTDHVNYNYYVGRVFYAWTQSQRTDYSVSAFGSRYQATNIDSKSTSEGVSGDMKYSWTETLATDLSASYQRVKQDETTPRIFSQTSNTWGANLSTVYTGAGGVSSYRVIIGRTIAPSSAGGLFATDQIRGQYDRDFTERLHFTGALRYFRDHTVAGVRGNDTRDYLTNFVRLQWMMTRRIFIAGSYTYVYQKYRVDPNSASANVVSLQMGYKGLERQH